MNSIQAHKKKDGILFVCQATGSARYATWMEGIKIRLFNIIPGKL